MVIRGVGLIQNISRHREHRCDRSEGRARLRAGCRAQCRIGAAPQTGIFGVNDQTGGVEGIVLMRRGENPSEVLTGDQGSRRRSEHDRAARRACASRRSTTARIWSTTRSHTVIAHAAGRPGDRGARAVPVSGQRARRAADRHHDSAVAAVRVRLHALFTASRRTCSALAHSTSASSSTPRS